ncbi:type II toxin-antitoxin system ParD family antitoxin [Bradyrhizobium betae]|uniref:Type II toxin-antitoxin system ParD family antitoxin n=1 Tax=Bradyrhizobium betae TaxID=244734 RepID=A0A5P6PAP2_9BRAD|nr:type II toxin-antitoxin system ParD family antitoxin [Bradyrhizobium betae]MCS3729200.1 antitoxin ParD1/3/4 [Bradyrhizobium betae]QFI74543.1 type II toxin-antitoxin system ParD family antitoxin [Bradyrhizobium betae]
MATSYSVGKHYESFIKDLVDSGRYATASEVMREGLRLIEEREERRKAELEALRAAVQEGRDSGPADPFEPGELVERVKARGREQLKAGKRGG